VLLGVVFGCAETVSAQQPLSAQAAVEAREVFVGEPFRFQVQISGTEKVLAKPGLSGFDAFRVEDLGNGVTSSRRVTIVNGRANETVQLGINLNYRLTAKRAGELVIPAVEVRTDKGSVRTQPVSIRALEPAETDKFKLRLSLPRQTCYVGEPVMLTVTWYLGQDVRGFEFSLPLLEDERFAFGDPEREAGRGGKVYRIPLGKGEVLAERSQGVLDGRTYATITFRKVLIPLQAGRVRIEPATVLCEALVGYRKSRDRFGGLFDDMFGRREGVYSRVVVPSNELTLDVLPVPDQGRPPGFAGHVGEYRIETAATPTDVSVGDPITLSVKLSGPSFLEHVSLPPLQEQGRLVDGFKIPEEMAEGKVIGGAKLFTQTIRAMRPDIVEIPPIELPYFDTAAGEYRVARSDPIPLSVKKARIVTAEDAEGREPVTAAGRSVRGWARGIVANYEDADRLLADQRAGPSVWVRSPGWLATLLVPPGLYAVLLAGVVLVRRRAADPAAVRRRRAFARSAARLGQTAGSAEDVLAVLRRYFADKFGFPGTAVTFADVRERLEAAGVGGKTVADVGRLFEACEAGQYAGGGAAERTPDALAGEARSVLADVERGLK
jgi:hypothetical protein